MLHVNRVHATDLFSYEVLDLTLKDRGLVLVEGPNGSGKTSIFDAFLWTLYGETTKKKLLADDVIREDQNHKPIKGNTRGYVNISRGEDTIEVFRHRKHKEYENKLLVYVNGDSVTLGTDTETQNKLDDLLGMDFKTCVSAILFPQDGDGFVDLGDAKQKEILDRIVDTARFTRAKEFNKRVLDTNKESLARFSATLFELQNLVSGADQELKYIELQQDRWMVETVQEIKRCKDALQDLNDNPPTVDPELEAKIEHAQSFVSQERFLDIQNRMRETSQELQDLKGKIAGYAAEKKFLVARVGPRIDIAPPKPPVSVKDPEAHSRNTALLNQQLSQCEAEIQVRQRDLVSVLKAVENYNGSCPLCGTKADSAAEARLIGESKKTQSDIEQSLIGLRKNALLWKVELEKNEKIQKEIDAWISYLASVEAYKQVDELSDSIESLELAVLEGQGEWVKLEQQYKELLGVRVEYDKLVALRQEQHQAVSAHAYEIAQAASRLKEAQARVSPYIEQLSGLKEKAAAAAKRLKSVQAWHEIVSRQVTLGTYWDRGFGNSGVKSLVLSHLFPLLTDQTNNYLDILADGKVKVDFSSQTKLGSGEVREKIECQVRMAEGGSTYNKASGGERRRVDLAVMFALGDLASERNKSRINLRLLDEPFDNLDAAGKERVVRALEQLVVPTAKTVLVMDHSESMKALVPQRIEVEKVGGKSRLLQ